MPRSFAQVRVAIWDDPDFRSLDADAQRLYFVLMTRADLSLCGVLPWHTGRFAELARDTTPNHIAKASIKLEKARFVLIDKATDECLLRTIVKHDEVLQRGPKLAGGVLSAWRSVYSQMLKSTIASEVGKLEGLSPTVREVVSPIVEWGTRYPLDTVSEEVSGHPSSSNQQPASSIERRSPNGSRMTIDWQPSEKCHDDLGVEFTDLDLPLELAAFRDHFLSKGETRKDWDAGFRNWCRNARKYASKSTPAKRTTNGLTDEQWQAAFERAQAADRAAGVLA